MSQRQIWDPISLLEVVNPNRRFTTCIGEAYRGTSRMRRCENHIAAVNKGEAEKILERLAFSEPSYTDMEGDLRTAMGCLLCLGRHNGDSSQEDKVLDTWCRRMSEEIRRIRERSRSRPATVTSRPSAPAPDRLDSLEQMIGSAADRLESWESFISETTERWAALHRQQDETNRLLNLLISELRIDTRGGRSFSRSTSSPRLDITARNSPHSADVPTDGRQTGDGSQQAAPRGLASSPPNPQPPRTRSPRPSTNTTQPSRTTAAIVQPPHTVTCTTAHVPRRPTDETCAICTETLADAPLADLVWCKRTCGRNVHRQCFALWNATGSHTCVFWYVLPFLVHTTRFSAPFC